MVEEKEGEGEEEDCLEVICLDKPFPGGGTLHRNSPFIRTDTYKRMMEERLHLHFKDQMCHYCTHFIELYGDAFLSKINVQ